MSNALEGVASLHRRRPVVGDAALVALLLVLGLASHAGDLQTTTAGRAFTVALVLPLLWRRRWPVGVFAVIALIAFAQWLADALAFGDAALLVALYGVAVSQPRRVALAAAAVVAFGVVLANLRWAPGNGLRGFVGLSGLATAAYVLGTNTRTRRALVASLQERAERLERERDQQGQLAAAAERARIARELHDVVAHNVSVMIALSDGAGYALDEDPARAKSAMRNASRTGRQALAELRRLLGVLRDGDGDAQLAPQPGLAQLDELLQDVRSAGLPVSYEVTGRPSTPLPPGLELAVFRIVQEALTNTLKHAGPGAEAQVRMLHGHGVLEVEVLDTGNPLPDLRVDGSAGLRGMRERAAVYDGELDAGPAPDGGWRVHLVLPLESATLSA
ncbi:MAG: two-component sensor histidine kinase [Frankiales bacterium]|nr:two-component sensor histidine kinase [Frankiales bacterium]MCW3014498.1 two-component sensor histidine kinase [Solirubrobacterales bacterium]